MKMSSMLLSVSIRLFGGVRRHTKTLLAAVVVLDVETLDPARSERVMLGVAHVGMRILCCRKREVVVRRRVTRAATCQIPLQICLSLLGLGLDLDSFSRSVSSFCQ